MLCEGSGAYDRRAAVCSVDGEDLNAWLVREGLALAYRKYSLDYIGQENAARAAGRGMWSGAFYAPWDQRRGAKKEVLGNQKTCPNLPELDDEGPPSPDCIIKGNRRKDEVISPCAGRPPLRPPQNERCGQTLVLLGRRSKSGRVPTCAVAWGSALLLFDGRRGAP